MEQALVKYSIFFAHSTPSPLRILVHGLDRTQSVAGSAIVFRLDRLEHIVKGILKVGCHHAIQSDFLAAHDGAEAALLDLAHVFVVFPAGMVGRDVDARVLLVPAGEIAVGFGFDGAQVAGDEVHDAAEFEFAVWEVRLAFGFFSEQVAVAVCY